MRKYAEVAKNFEDKIAALGFRPAKKYIAYNAGQSFHTDDFAAARAFSPLSLIETIVPEPTELQAWRAARVNIEDQIKSQWKAELFEEGGLDTDISEKILRYTDETCDTPDERAAEFERLSYLVVDCIKLATRADK